MYSAISDPSLVTYAIPYLPLLSYLYLPNTKPHKISKYYSSPVQQAEHAESCSVCLEPAIGFISKIDTCGHKFHKECILNLTKVLIIG